MVEPADTRSGHVPQELIYGPVQSRRFGTSLGVSFSAPGATVCHWRCPYCQLGDWPFSNSAPWPPAEEVITQLRSCLASCEAPAVITVAGGGEPSDHPAFADLSRACAELAGEVGARLLLLSNADGLVDPEKRAALSAYDDVHIKWDPGPRAGSWRPGTISRAERISLLHKIAPLHLQTMLFHDARGGNCRDQDIARYCYDLRELQPERVHLGSIDRDPRLPDKQAVSKEELRRLADQIALEAGVSVILH